MRAPRTLALAGGVWLVAASAALAERNKGEWAPIIKGWSEMAHATSRLIVYGTGGLGVVLVGGALFVLAGQDEDRGRWRAMTAIAIGSLFTIFAVILGAVTRILVP